MNSNRPADDRSWAQSIQNGAFPRLGRSEIESHQTYDGVCVESESLTGVVLPGVAFEHCRFDRTELSETEWNGPQLREVLLDRCTLTNAVWDQCRWEVVEVRRSQMTGFTAAEGRLRRVHFMHCKLDLSLFHDAQLRDCCFDACDLREADFQGSRLTNVVFRNCDLRSARFPAASMEEVDLRGSHLVGLDVEPDSLRGTIVDQTQIGEIVELFGLIVRPLDEEKFPAS